MDQVAPRPADTSSWADRPARERAGGQNAITVDVEDYFQVEALADLISRSDWNSRECRIERNLDRILGIFSDAKVKGTFFTLGWIAERYRSLVRRIVDEGHELASHGHAHLRADRLTPDAFAADISRSKMLLEDISGRAVIGYRAPCFSISERNLWALQAVEAAGYRYSSSIYPIRHDNYGSPGAPRHAFYPFEARQFIEIPISSVRLLGANWPCGGGGYFRLFPLSLSLAALGRIRRGEQRACVFYFHPWEIDPDQPRIGALSLKSRFRHYTNLSRMETRITALLRHFSWNRIDRIFPVTES
jgi:polysaccharide deacetylase family protein (PEP-CTERM system associated)